MVQRVARARVTVDDEAVGEIGDGLCVLLGVAREDDPAAADRLAARVDLSLLDTGGGALVVSQFTLIADTARGNRPSFSDAAPPELAELLYERFCEALEGEGIRVARGVFGARMQVELVNDGPVTIVVG